MKSRGIIAIMRHIGSYSTIKKRLLHASNIRKIRPSSLGLPQSSQRPAAKTPDELRIWDRARGYCLAIRDGVG